MAKVHSNHEWLSLIDVSGPFLASPVLEKAFPQGLEPLNPYKKKQLRQAYDEWSEANETEDKLFTEIHKAWIDLVLKQGLELDEDNEGDTLKSGTAIPEKLNYQQPEYGITLKPDYVVVDDQQNDAALMLISTYNADVDLDAIVTNDGWAMSPLERMAQLCRATETRLGLVTNGERWVLIDAPVGAVTTFASWYARLWSQEPITLQAFTSLLGIRRFFVAKEEQLTTLLDDSLQHQDEVTDALGSQVSRAVEVLIQALDKADLDRNRELLEGVKPTELYEAALTIMMRLVFLLSAEERELMDVVKDERFDAYYAVSSLRMQLREQAGLHSEEILSHRRDAWSRLLAIFRAIYGGIEHENLRMPALGGSLFDPDRFPFLEGRAQGTSWLTDEAKPLPIDNRTVLLLLDAIQLFQGRTLSYRALDIENIGYVYEGLLERTVERAKEVTLDLDATKNAKKPWVTLNELDEAQAFGKEAVEKLLKERTGSAISRVRNDLKKDIDPSDTALLLTACQNDKDLSDRISPYFYLLRTDRWGYPLVYPKDTFMVTTGSDRRETGTHYTPKSLTESIVKETLEPIVYTGPADGFEREDWKIKFPAELLDLKICDPAMGSGAFLVQTCRWLSERLVESWSIEETNGKSIDANGQVFDKANNHELLSANPEERLITARRLIAERCLYGVDINPLAVELAKLSIWLVTLAKGRPFGFLDHNLRSGDSLLGVTDLNQLYYLDMKVGKGSMKKLFAQKIDPIVFEAIKLRMKLRKHQIRDIYDIEFMKSLDQQARDKLMSVECIADALVGEDLLSGNKKSDTTLLSIRVSQVFDDDKDSIDELNRMSQKNLNVDLIDEKSFRKPFHWCLEFPEVFNNKTSGFNAIVGNPPFLGGLKITEKFGERYGDYLASHFNGNNKVDLCLFFLKRAFYLLYPKSYLGLITSNTISQGVTRKYGLAVLLDGGASIINAHPSFNWPGDAAVIATSFVICNGHYKGDKYLDQIKVDDINSHLSAERDEWSVKKLRAQKKICFQGSNPLGKGFYLDISEADKMFSSYKKNQEVVKHVIGGKELNSRISQNIEGYIIDFFERTYEEAGRYILPFKFAKDRVYPERMLKNAEKYPRMVNEWWKFWHSRKALYDLIQSTSIKRVLARSRVSGHHMIDFLPSNIVYTEALAVWVLDGFDEFGVLQSSIHEVWMRKFASSLKNDVRYIPGDCFETFSFPKNITQIAAVAERFYELRNQLKGLLKVGLTSLYNKIHSKSENSESINQLRKSICELDQVVLESYGWGDIELHHAFHEVSYLPKGQNIRYSISESARRNIIYRLTLLNKECYETESKSKQVKSKVQRRASHKTSKVKSYESPGFHGIDHFKVAEPPPPQMDIFSNQNELKDFKNGNQWGNESIYQILAWLEAHNGWHSKQNILNGCQATPSHWEAATTELLEDEFIEVRGEYPEVFFRAKE
jgi:hypothetical protein